MKSNIFTFLKSFFLIFIFSNVIAEEPRFYIPDSPPIAAKSYVLMDHNSGKILAGENENERRAPASLTKIMTSYVIFKRLKEDLLRVLLLLLGLDRCLVRPLLNQSKALLLKIIR